MALEDDGAMFRLRWSVGRSTAQVARDVGVLWRRRVGHNKERPKVVVEEAGSEVARLGKMIEVTSPHEKEKEVKVAIAREEMHSRYESVNGNITYR